MPIRAEMRALYPPDWPAISDWIRFDRALGRCECHGECKSRLHWSWWADAAASTPHGILGRPKPPVRCPNYHLEPSRFTGSRVILTTAHLEHNPTVSDPVKLRAMCQACHLAYDAEHHAATRRRGH